MSTRRNIASGTQWEEIAGYSRAVRIGNTIHVSGTTATNDEGKLVGGDDIYEQTKYVIRKIEQALNEAGATLYDVVRTRIYVTDIQQWEGAARAHADYFGKIRPANTLLEVSALVGDEYLVEMEAEAIVE